ncbi:MAG: DUF2948 family protein [Alphaproteobacteria bacterium]|nr:DUF2948 family protein [Alphaproteobacteria bacterium]
MDANVLKLLADDAESLSVIASAVQDALVRPSEIRFDARARGLVIAMNRFRWEVAGSRAPYFRSRAVLVFSGVETVQSSALPRRADTVLALLDVRFTAAADPPGGIVQLVFAEGGRIRLDVECIDVTLLDTGQHWPTRRKPDHGASA